MCGGGEIPLDAASAVPALLGHGFSFGGWSVWARFCAAEHVAQIGLPSTAGSVKQIAQSLTLVIV